MKKQKDINQIEDALELVESVGNRSEISNLTIIRVQQDISSLKHLDVNQVSNAEEILIESLRNFYLGVKESIEDEMVTEE